MSNTPAHPPTICIVYLYTNCFGHKLLDINKRIQLLFRQLIELSKQKNCNEKFIFNIVVDFILTDVTYSLSIYTTEPHKYLQNLEQLLVASANTTCTGLANTLEVSQVNTFKHEASEIPSHEQNELQRIDIQFSRIEVLRKILSMMRFSENVRTLRSF